MPDQLLPCPCLLGALPFRLFSPLSFSSLLSCYFITLFLSSSLLFSCLIFPSYFISLLTPAAFRDRGLQRTYLPIPGEKSSNHHDLHLWKLPRAISHQGGRWWGIDDEQSAVWYAHTWHRPCHSLFFLFLLFLYLFLFLSRRQHTTYFIALIIILSTILCAYLSSPCPLSFPLFSFASLFASPLFSSLFLHLSSLFLYFSSILYLSSLRSLSYLSTYPLLVIPLVSIPLFTLLFSFLLS